MLLGCFDPIGKAAFHPILHTTCVRVLLCVSMFFHGLFVWQLHRVWVRSFHYVLISAKDRLSHPCPSHLSSQIPRLFFFFACFSISTPKPACLGPDSACWFFHGDHVEFIMKRDLPHPLPAWPRTSWDFPVAKGPGRVSRTISDHGLVESALSFLGQVWAVFLDAAESRRTAGNSSMFLRVFFGVLSMARLIM